MQNLMNVQTMTMSSREISKLTGKDHGSIVIRDIWNMISDLYGAEKDAANLQDKKNQQVTISDGITIIIDHRGYVFEFLLDRDHTECLLTGYSALLRMRVIQRWRELEERQSQFHIPQTLPDALRLAAELAEETQRLTLVNKEQDVEIHDLKNLFKEGMTTTQFCKMLNGVNTQQVNHWLADRNWLYNESKSGTDRTIFLIKPALDVLRNQAELTRLGKQFDTVVSLREYGRSARHLCTFVFNPKLTTRNKTAGDHYAAGSVKAIWNAACKRAGVRHRNAYQSRHTYACWSLSAGANPSFIATQLGHADAQMVYKVYGRWMSERNSEQVELLNRNLTEFAPSMPHEMVKQA